MYNPQNGTFEMANQTVCEHCGSVTMAKETGASNKKSGLAYVITGWVFSLIALVFMPILFGAVAVAMGFMTFFERSKVHGAILLVFAFASLIIGSLISFFVAGTMFI